MKYKVTLDGITKTYAVLHHTAGHFLETVKTRQDGSLLSLQGAVVFYAFTFEAYLNHVGAKEFEIWEEIERISHDRKLRIIAKHLKLIVDHSRPPFRTIRELFTLRDTLAHGRTKVIDYAYETDEEPDPMSPWNIHEWERLTTTKVVEYAEAVSTAIETINASRQPPDELLWSQGMWGGDVELL